MTGLFDNPKQPTDVTAGPKLGAAQGFIPQSHVPDMSFEEWKKKYAPHDSGKDYDLKAAWAAGLKPDPNEDMHFPDTFKRPDHPKFSVESIYWKPGMPAGRWEGEGQSAKYIRMTGPEATAWVKEHGQNLAPGFTPQYLQDRRKAAAQQVAR